MPANTSRARIRPGRAVRFFPNQAQATALGVALGDSIPAVIAKVNSDGTVNLKIDAAAAIDTSTVDGTYGAPEAAVLASLRDKAGIVESVSQGSEPGQYSLIGAQLA